MRKGNFRFYCEFIEKEKYWKLYEHSVMNPESFLFDVFDNAGPFLSEFEKGLWELISESKVGRIIADFEILTLPSEKLFVSGIFDSKYLQYNNY